jgi:hypothetical protein
VRNVQLEDDPSLLASVRVAESDLYSARHGHLRILVEDPEHLHLRARPDLDAHVLRCDLRQPVELPAEDAWRGVRGLCVVRVAAARVGHPSQQLLVEVGADPDRRRADPFARGRSRELRRGGRDGSAGNLPVCRLFSEAL